ncbi:MAG: hypothetical protein DRI90_11715 [Deltaproteobacteria bacterium]|nr:MAG: hypothetical protein DRI90_11715 [Deltaproteobacteria bacterium]
MKLDDLAKHLSDLKRIGLNPELAKKLGVVDEDVTRGRLLAQSGGERGHLQVLFLGCYVVDDTDFWGDGEIYWWSVPAILDQEGMVTKNALHALPNGAPPHKCGDNEWMTNLSLQDPPVWAVIPPGEDVDACVIRLGIYDDDREPADLPAAMTTGLETLTQVANEPLAGSGHIINPVRDAIFESLQAEQDDILVEQDITMRKGQVRGFGAGMIGSVVNAMVRAYYFTRDTKHTRQFGPITLHKGETQRVKFDVPLEQGGRLAIFARGHDVNCPRFGVLHVDEPFINRVLTRLKQDELENGFEVMGTGPAKFVAYYTPSYSD